ncbi:hypothetical protein ACTS94_16275 [Empedobacter falsenii]
MKLIPMTDFVLEQTELLYEKNQSKLIHRVVNYAQFLKQPLTLGMFVPCDEEGNILEEPKDYDLGLKFPYSNNHSIECEKYQQAKERVLFEFDGELSLIKNKSNFYIIEDKNGVYLRILKNKTKTTIESLLKFSVEITLTQTAIKQIGL